MIQEDKVALKDFLIGAAVAIGITVIFLSLFFAFGNTDLKPSAEVVDTYRGCDIVRWSNGQMAEYKYFLHCNNTRPVYGK